MFILTSVSKSLQCLISALTQGAEGGHLFRLACSVVLWGGRNTVNLSVVCGGSAHSVWTTVGLPLLTVACAFLVYTAQAPSCSAGVLSKAGPPFHALLRSKLLRFRFSGTPQRHRLGWACVFLPFPGPSSSGNKVLGEHSVPGGPCVLVTSLVLAARFPGSPLGLLWGAISGCSPPGRYQPSSIPGRFDWQLGACSQFGGGCSLCG